MKKCQYVFESFRLLSGNGVDYYIDEMMSKEYSEDSGFGFEYVLPAGNDEYVDAILLKKVVSKVNVWSEGIPVTENMDRIERVPFVVNLKNGYVMVEGGHDEMDMLKEALRQCFCGEFVFEGVDVRPEDWICGFDGLKTLTYCIDEVTVDKFILGNGVSGRFTARSGFTKQFIDENAGKISRMRFLLKVDGSLSLWLTVDDNGSALLEWEDGDAKIPYRSEWDFGFMQFVWDAVWSEHSIITSL